MTTTQILVKHLKDKSIELIFSTLAEPLLGPSQAGFVYHGLLDILTGQTLGDELTGLKGAKKSLRLMLLWLVLHKGLRAAGEFHGIEAAVRNILVRHLKYSTAENVLEHTPTVLDALIRIHQGAFFLFHTEFFSIADRVCGIKRKTKAGEEKFPTCPSWVLKLVGISMVSVGLADFLKIAIKIREKRIRTGVGEHQDTITRSQHPLIQKTVLPECSICVTPCRVPTSASCGHVFCWSCIASWVSGESERCPICKASCRVNQLLPLNHYGVRGG